MTSFLRNLFNLRPPATQLELQRQQKLLQVANEQLLIENETLESLEKTMLAFQRKKRDLKDKEQFLIESRRSLLIELQESSDADAAKNEAFLRDEFPKTLDSLRKKLILFDRQIGDLENTIDKMRQARSNTSDNVREIEESIQYIEDKLAKGHGDDHHDEESGL